MIEPTSQAAAAIAASISGITLALLGVDHYALVYGLVGSLFALFQAERMGRGKAVLFVLLSTLAGAAMGSSVPLVAGLLTSKPLPAPALHVLLLVSCIVCGFGVQAILDRLLRRGLHIIDGKSPGAAPGDEGGNSP